MHSHFVLNKKFDRADFEGVEGDDAFLRELESGTAACNG